MPRRNSWQVDGVLSLIFFFIAAAHADPVLITSFEPFGGNTTNGSQLVANQLQALNAASLAPLDLHFCTLPVVYDRAAEVAQKCALATLPSLVISLGEADCDVLRLETVAHNWDGTPGFPDNAGVIRNGSAIISGESDHGFRFPVDQFYCALPADERAQIKVSVSAGAFVRNNTAFHLQDFFAPTKTNYTFIHVQNSRCANLDVARSARLVLQGLRAVQPSGAELASTSQACEADFLGGRF